MAEAPASLRAGWARLDTGSPCCLRHEEDDATITALIRAKGAEFGLSPEVFRADPGDFERLESFPVLFAPDLTAVTGRRQRENLQEYLLRGGFVYVDACANPDVTPSFRDFLEQHLKLLSSMVGGAHAALLRPTHRIFTVLYPVNESRLLEFYRQRQSTNASAFDGGLRPSLYAFYDDNRIFAVVSLHFLRCTWHGQSREEEMLRKQMAANIHAFGLGA